MIEWVLFCFNSIKQVNTGHKIKDIVSKSLLAGYKFIPEMHLRLGWFTYSGCRTLTKSKERIQKFKETGESRYIYQTR